MLEFNEASLTAEERAVVEHAAAHNRPPLALKEFLRMHAGELYGRWEAQYREVQRAAAARHTDEYLQLPPAARAEVEAVMARHRPKAEPKPNTQR